MTDDQMDDTITLTEFAELAGISKPGLINARKRSTDFPPALPSEHGRAIFLRRDVEEWIARREERRRVSAVRHGVLATRPGSLRLSLAVSYLTLLEAERRAAIVPSVQSFSLDTLCPRTRAVLRTDPSLSGWLDDVLCGVITPAEAAGLAELDSTAQALGSQSWASMVDDLARERAVDGLMTTPQVLVDLMGGMAGPSTVGVFDPAAGRGALLLDAPGVGPNVPLYGQDVSEEAAVVARCRAYFRGRHLEIRIADSVDRGGPWTPPGEIDRIVCHPPFGSDPTMRGIELVFARRAANTIQGGGTAVVLVPSASLNMRRYTEIRRALLHTQMLRAVIQLPRVPDTGTRIPLSLLVLTPDCQQPSDDILFLDLSGDMLPSRRQATADPAWVTEAVVLTRGWLAGESASLSSNTTVVSASTILSSEDAQLQPANYIFDTDTQLEPAKAREQVRLLESQLSNSVKTLKQVKVPDEVAGISSIPVRDAARMGMLTVIPGLRLRDAKTTAIAPADVPDGFTGITTLRALRHTGSLDPIEALPSTYVTEEAHTEPGDIVFALIGTPIAVVDREGGRVITSPLAILRPHSNRLNPTLVAAALQSPLNVRRTSNSGIGRVDTTSLVIPVVDDTEQGRALLQTFQHFTTLREELQGGLNLMDSLLLQLVQMTQVAAPAPSRREAAQKRARRRSD